MKLPSKTWIKRLAWSFSALLALYVLVGFIVLPWALRPKLEKILTTALHRPVTIGQIAFNPFLLKATVRDFKVAEAAAPLLQFSALTVDVELASLWQGGPVVREVTLENPQIHITRLAADRYNFSDLLVQDQAAKPKEASKELPRFSINHIRLNNGRIVLDDQYLHARQEVSELALSIPFVSTLPAMLDDFIEPGLSGKLNGQHFALKGKTKPFEDSRETSLSFDLDHLNLPDYLAYVPLNKGVTLPSGALSAQLQLIFRQGKGRQTVLLHGGAQLADVRLEQNAQPIFTLPRFAVEGFALDLAKHQIDVANIAAEGGAVQVVRQKEGAINFTRLLRPSVASAPVAKVDDAKPAAPSPWRVKVAQFALQNWSLGFLDQKMAASPLQLHALNLRVNQLDTQAKAAAKLDFAALLGKRGSLAVQGDFTAQPFAGKWALDLRQIDAAYGQPYFTQLLNIKLASGFVSAKGDLTLATQPAFAGHYDGQFGVSDLHAVDKLSGQDFLKWKSLDFKAINTDFAPLNLAVGEIALRDFYSRLILNQDGRMNVQDVVVKDGQAKSVTASSVASAPVSAPPAQPLPPVRIGKVVLSGGNIQYSDNLIRPNFNANLTDMGGLLAGLSTEEKSRATLDLRGSVDKIAPVAIAGTLNPLAQKRFVDIKASVKGYELTAASTYAAKYAGYGIAKGQLSLDLAYFIDGQKLKAGNQLLLDQLTLGAKSDSKDAVSLPVRFALAILTDRQGQIKVNLPIEGTLDDPEFKVGSVIWQVLVNLMEKAVTAPFDALASLVGGDASLAYSECAPGSAAISNKEAISKLAKALAERPALKLEIAGWVDPELDSAALKRAMLMDKLRAHKLALLAGKGESVDEARLAEISPAEYPRLLEDVFNAEKLPKPQVASGVVSATAEMEKALLAHIQVTPDQLQKLALARAQNAKDALQEAGVADVRLFITSPQLTPVTSEIKSGKTTRVQFVLR